MDFEKYDGSIIIVKDSLKNRFLNLLRKNKKLIDIKIMGIEEFKKKYYFDYNSKTIYYVYKKYNVIKDIAKIYIDNLYYIKEMDDTKIEFLNKVKKDLIQNKLLIEDSNFKKYIKTKKIVLYDLKYIDNFYKNMFDEIKETTEVIFVNSETDITVKELYKFERKESEVAFVAAKICELIKQGININKIKMANVNKTYLFTIKNIFKDFNIPINLNFEETISSTILVQKFKKLYKDNIEQTLEEIKPLIIDETSEKIYGKIVDIINNYNWCDNYILVKGFIFDDIDNIKLPPEKYKNAIEVIDITSDIIEEDEHIFLINFNQGIIPANKKDEDYLNDTIKRQLNISDSVDINKKRIRELQEKIGSTKNLVVSYSKRDLNNELYLSNAYDEKLFTDCEYQDAYQHSNKFNKKLLLCDKDENKKYGTVTKRYELLNSHYKDEPYNSYDNTYKHIDELKIKTYLNNQLTLSYSSMNTYYQCGFRYYLDNVLRINKFEDSFEIVVGNIFHEMLSKCFLENFNFDTSWNQSIQNQKYEFVEKDYFFLNILKEELIFIIDVIKEEKDYSSLQKALYEKKIVIPIDEINNVIFKGFVDKIQYDEFGDTKIVSIIDYKTGTPELNINNTMYGLEMQLPIYAYLIKKSPEFKDAKIGGFYLQKILNNIKDQDKKKDSLKLQGYSNSSIEILSKLDSSYADSKMIKSLKLGNNGFYAYSKILTDTQIDKLIKIVEEKIKEAAEDILKAKFDINPKQIGDKQVGCKFCKYSDICYMKNDDIKKLKEIDKKDFLGGNEDAQLD